MTSHLILMRHGQSAWNAKNIFTGWVDVPLSPQGMEEAIEGGKRIRDCPIDHSYTSTLLRAQMTLAIALWDHASGKVPIFLHSDQEKTGQWAKIQGKEALEQIIPVTIAWQLNERMYGDLQGLNKEQTAKTYGAEQVQQWRRSFDVAPPGGESLAQTAARAVPYFQREIAREVQRGKNCLVVAHGNSLRSIVMHLEQLSPQEVVQLELPTGEPRIYAWRGERWERA